MRLNRLALLIALPLLYQQIACAKSHRDVVENAKKFTVLVTNEGLLGGGRGTGILLDATHVLTCMHMAKSYKDEMFVYTYPFGTVIKGHVTNVNADNDLALITLESSATVRVKPVFQVTHHDGDSITVLGNALGGMKWLVTGGVISGEERGDILSDAAVNPGDSGGPWINEKGEIVAMTDWRVGPDEHYPGITGGTSSEEMLAFLKSLEDQKKVGTLMMLLLGGAK